MKSECLCKRSKEALDAIADEITKYLRTNTPSFSPKQLLLSHQIMNLLGEMVDELDNNNIKKARKLSIKVDSKLFDLCMINYL